MRFHKLFRAFLSRLLIDALRFCNIGRQPNFVVWYTEWNYGTFAEGATYIRWAAITLSIGPHSSFL